jgi:hypothetical protein
MAPPRMKTTAKQTPAKRPSVADECQPVVDPLANVRIPRKKRATEAVAAPPPDGKAADKALNVAEHAMKKAPAMSADAVLAVASAGKADADVELEIIDEVELEKRWGSPWDAWDGAKRWTAPSHTHMFPQFTHDPVSGKKQLIVPRSEQLVKQFEFRLGRLDKYPTMKEFKDFMNDLEELLPFKRFQDHFVNRLKQRYPVRVLTAMIGGDYFPRNRDGHDSEAVLEGIMQDIKSIPKGTPLEHRHKEYFSIFRRLLNTLEQHERVKQAMQEHFGANQSGQQTVATPVAPPKPTPKPTPTQSDAHDGSCKAPVRISKVYGKVPIVDTSTGSLFHQAVLEAGLVKQLPDRTNIYVPLAVCGIDRTAANAFKRFCVCELDGFLTMDKYGVGFKCNELGRGNNATDYKYGVNEPYTMSAQAKSMVVGLMHYVQDFARLGKPVPNAIDFDGLTADELRVAPYQEHAIKEAIVNASARQALADQSASWIAANSPGKLVLGVDVFSDWEPKFRNLLRGIPGASEVPLIYVLRDENWTYNADDYMQSIVALLWWVCMRCV